MHIFPIPQSQIVETIASGHERLKTNDKPVRVAFFQIGTFHEDDILKQFKVCDKAGV